MVLTTTVLDIFIEAAAAGEKVRECVFLGRASGRLKTQAATRSEISAIGQGSEREGNDGDAIM